jgi:hypothetical protein
MPGFVVRHRSTTPWTEETVDAETREEAIHKVLDAAQEGMEVEVSTVVEAEPAPKHAPAAKKEEHHSSGRK